MPASAKGIPLLSHAAGPAPGIEPHGCCGIICRMTGDQWVLVITAVVTALSGLSGTVLGGWITKRGAEAGKRAEEIARARVALLRLATTLVSDATDDAMAVAEEAAVASIALGYESGTALKILDAMRSWARFEPGGFP